MWYLYALVGLYAILPIIGKWYASASRREHLFFLAAWFCASSASVLIDLLNRLAGKNIDILGLYNMSEFASYIGFFVLGAVIFENTPKRFSAKTPLALFVLCGLITAAITQVLSSAFEEPYGKFYGYRSPLVIAAAASFFIFALKSGGAKGLASLAASAVARHSLGIYCVHAFVLSGAQKLILQRLESCVTGAWLSAAVIAATSLAVFMISLCIAAALRKIPLLRQAVM